MNHRDLPLLAVTPGEPAGIGAEILIKLAESKPDLPLLAVADLDWLRATARTQNSSLEIDHWQPGNKHQPGRLACLPVPLAEPVVTGQPNPANAQYVLDTLSQAVELVMSGQAHALVTGPVQKSIINDAGIPFSGHTEYLAALSETPRVVMMLACESLRVCLVTTHLPLSRVPAAITETSVEETIRITHSTLKRQFDIEQPRLQILGLNPHAGEDGHLGHEDDAIIRPVIEKLRAEGMNLLGPVPADTAFTPDRIAACDAVIAMYHDQGLPMLKHLGFGQAINVTLGLPFIRTSVDHGTALDIAGTGKADISSLEAAVEAALGMQQV